MKEKVLEFPKKFLWPDIEEQASERLFYVEGDEDVIAVPADMTMAEFGKWVSEKTDRLKLVYKLAKWLDEFTAGDSDLACDLLKKELTKREANKKVQEFCPIMVKDNNVYYLEIEEKQIEKITFSRANVAKTLYIFFLRQIERAIKDSTEPKCLSKVEIAGNQKYLDDLQRIYEKISGKKCDIKSWFLNSNLANDFTNALSSIRKAFEDIFFIPQIKVYRKCYSIEIMGEDDYGNPRYGIGLTVSNFDLGEYGINANEEDKSTNA
jgi:hypothetical protein